MSTRLTRVFTVTALLVGLFVNSSNGQAFTIEALDGGKQVVQVSSEKNESVLSIKCEEDAIYIGGLNNIEAVRMLNKHFLMVTYQLRSGVGMRFLKTLIVSVNNHKLHESLHVVSLFKEYFMDFSKPSPQSIKVSVKTVYSVEVALNGDNSSGYKIKANIHDEKTSIDKPKSNYNNNLVASLSFNRSENIFYSSTENISRNFTVVDAETKNEAKKNIKGVFPVVKLGKEKYNYKDGRWYEWSEGNSLAQESYR